MYFADSSSRNAITPKRKSKECHLPFTLDLSISTMQATIGCLSRIVSRSLVTGVVTSKEGTQPKNQTKLVTAVSGFPKQKSGYSIDNILKGQIGDDAYFVARHIDDWNNNTPYTDEATILNPSTAHQQEEEARNPTRASSKNNSADVIGVADGVGGWRQYGVDPGQFSSQLMSNCERLVKNGYFSPTQPARLLAQGFREMQECKKQIIGSSTACVVMLSHADLRLYTANIGDSGFLVVRNGEVVLRSQEQQHFFNTPYQLSLPPSEMASDVLADRPEAADRYEFNVEDGDVILLATDGLFDNVPDFLLLDEISSNISKNSSSNRSPTDSPDLAVRLQQCANSIALIARKLSQDPNFLSPFAKNARASGIMNVRGGKEDDITVLLAAVNLNGSPD